MRFANVRMGGMLADLNIEHMQKLGAKGIQAKELAEVIRDQVFQLALVMSWVAYKQGFSQEQLSQGLMALGDKFAQVYAAQDSRWQENMPVDLETMGKEILFALQHRQGAKENYLGFYNGPFSMPSLAAFAETVAQSAVKELADRAMEVEQKSPAAYGKVRFAGDQIIICLGRMARL